MKTDMKTKNGQTTRPAPLITRQTIQKGFIVAKRYRRAARERAESEPF